MPRGSSPTSSSSLANAVCGERLALVALTGARASRMSLFFGVGPLACSSATSQTSAPFEYKYSRMPTRMPQAPKVISVYAAASLLYRSLQRVTGFVADRQREKLQPLPRPSRQSTHRCELRTPQLAELWARMSGSAALRITTRVRFLTTSGEDGIPAGLAMGVIPGTLTGARGQARARTWWYYVG